MKFTLRFYALGTPIKGNNYNTYLRYYHSGTSLNIPTSYPLTKEQVKLLNKGELGGAIQNNLDTYKSDVRQVILGLYNTYMVLPSPAQVKELFKDVEHELNIEWYINEYMKQLTTKRSSKVVYGSHLKQFKSYYEHNLKKVPLPSLINKQTIENYGVWLTKKSEVQHKSISKLQVYNMKGSAIRLLNFIAEKRQQTPIPFYLKQPALNDHYTPNAEEFEAIVSVDTETKAQKRVQDMVYINGFWGLRVNELLSIRKQNITFNGDHLSVKFTDFKSTRSRDVVLMDKKAIEIVHSYMNTKGDYLNKMDDTFFNNNLRAITELALHDKSTFIYNAKEEKDVKHEIAKVITSHSIRRYAVIRNIELYGIDVARTFSGHKNYQIVVRHYAKDFLDKRVAIEKLREDIKRNQR